MKGEKALFSSKSDEYETPHWIFDPLNNLYRFTLDPCATAKNTKCKRFYTKTDDGLSKSWAGERVFMNPPYSEVGKWVSKALEECLHPYTCVVGVVASRTDTDWFHKLEDSIGYGHHRKFLKGRVSFGGSDGPAPFPTLVFFIGCGAFPLLHGVTLLKPKVLKKAKSKEIVSREYIDWASS